MKKTLCVLGTFLLFVTSRAQTRIEKSGNDVNKDKTPHYVSMIGSDDAYFYTLRVDKNIGGLYQGEYSIDQMSKTNTNYVKRIATGSNDTRTENAPTAVMVKDKIYLFTKFNNKSKKTCEFTLDEIITSATNKTPNSRALISFPMDAKSWYQTSFETSISPDSSKIGIVAKYMNDVTFYLYNLSDFKEISNKKISRPNDKIASGRHFKIDNAGNLFYSLWETQKFSLYQISANDGKVTSCSFNSNKSYNMGDVDYIFDMKNNQIYVHTLFYEKNTNPKLDNNTSIGIFIAKVDKNNLSVIKEKYHPFNSGILDAITCGKPEKGIAGSRIYRSNLILTENSDILFEAEQTAMAQTNRGTNVGSMYDMSTQISFDANELVISKLSSNLDLTWMKLIPRSNTYSAITNTTESTIACTKLYTGGKLKYYFIEHPKFEEKQMDYSSINACETPFIRSYPGTNIVEYSLDKTGKLEKRVVFSNKKEWLIPVFYDLNLGNNKYMVRFRDDNKEHFSIFNLN